MPLQNVHINPDPLARVGPVLIFAYDSTEVLTYLIFTAVLMCTDVFHLPRRRKPVIDTGSAGPRVIVTEITGIGTTGGVL